MIKVFAIISVCLAPEFLECELPPPVRYDGPTQCERDKKNVLRHYYRQFAELGPKLRVMVICRPRVLRPE